MADVQPTRSRTVIVLLATAVVVLAGALAAILFTADPWCNIRARPCAKRPLELSPNEAYFEGLDRAAVAEFVANEDVQRLLESEEPGQRRESLAQGAAINFIVCRDAYRVYQDWIDDGEPPNLAGLPSPSDPRPSYADWKQEYADLKRVVRSGQAPRLREWLIGMEATCGRQRWIPAEPNTDGPTIEVAILRAEAARAAER